MCGPVLLVDTVPQMIATSRIASAHCQLCVSISLVES